MIVGTKHLLHVYHCQHNILVEMITEFCIQSRVVQSIVQVVQVAVKNMMVLEMEPKGMLEPT